MSDEELLENLGVPPIQEEVLDEESEDSIRIFIGNVLLFFAKEHLSTPPVMDVIVREYRAAAGPRTNKRTLVRALVSNHEFPANLGVAHEAPAQPPPVQQDDALAKLIGTIATIEKNRLAERKKEIDYNIKTYTRRLRTLDTDLRIARAELSRNIEDRLLLRTRTAQLSDNFGDTLAPLLAHLRNSALFDASSISYYSKYMGIPTRDVWLRDFRPDHGIDKKINLGRMWVVIDMANFRVEVKAYTNNCYSELYALGQYDHEYGIPAQQPSYVKLHPHISSGDLCWGSAGPLYNSLYGKPLAFMEVPSLVELMRKLEGILTTYNSESPYVPFAKFKGWATLRDAVTSLQANDMKGCLFDYLPDDDKKGVIHTLTLAVSAYGYGGDVESVSRNNSLVRRARDHFGGSTDSSVVAVMDKFLTGECIFIDTNTLRLVADNIKTLPADQETSNSLRFMQAFGGDTNGQA